MQLEDIEEEGKESRWSKLTKPSNKTEPSTFPPPPPSTINMGDSSPRRGSHLMAAAGIDLEKRRKRASSTTTETKIYNDGGEWVEEKDGKITKLEIVEVKEKMGRMRKSVPILPVPIALLLCLLNLFLPGVGTFIGAGTLLCGAKCHHENTRTGVKYASYAGLIQIILAPLLVGWIFSIYYGVNIVHDAMAKAAIKPEVVVTEEEKTSKPSSKDELNVQAWA